jgi:hypothetical protein
MTTEHSAFEDVMISILTAIVMLALMLVLIGIPLALLIRWLF